MDQKADQLMEFSNHKKAQDAAKKVFEKIPRFIHAEMTESEIARLSTKLLAEEGVSDTWYYGVHALVLLGSRSCLSISGKEYSPSSEKVRETNLITIDLSPEVNGCWGDCARSFVVENGEVVKQPSIAEMSEGLAMETWLHEQMKENVDPSMTFNDLYLFGNDLIKSREYRNLDFLGNLGHSIVHDKADRIYIEEGCGVKLGEVQFFTFEPHIKKMNGVWGFKHENIYYFNKYGHLNEL